MSDSYRSSSKTRLLLTLYELWMNCSSVLLTIFAPLEDSLMGFCEAILKHDSSASVEMLVVLDGRIPQVATELQAFARILRHLQKRLLQHAEAFLAEQVSSIEAIKFSAKKRSGLFPFVAVFPAFVARMERLLRKCDEHSTCRELMTRGYERISASISRSLDALTADAERSDDEKERINAAVMNIRKTSYVVFY